MDDQSPSVEQLTDVPPPTAQPLAHWVTEERLLAIFLVCLALGFIGTLIGFVPLIALAMIGPLVAAILA